VAEHPPAAAPAAATGKAVFVLATGRVAVVVMVVAEVGVSHIDVLSKYVEIILDISKKVK
jgi:hypothetical protein